MAKKRAFDRALFTAIVVLVFCGLVMVFSASAAVAWDESYSVNPFLVKQCLAAGLGLLLMGITMHLDYTTLNRPLVVYPLVGGVLVLLLLVLFQPPLNSARRWFFLPGGLSFQPSELAKLALVLFLSYHIARKPERINHPHFLVPTGVALALTCGLVLLEPDLGTTVLLAATSLVMLFIAGLSWRFLAAAALAGVPVLYLLVISEPYRLRRLTAFLRPEEDPLGSGFQAFQSLIAVGSGGPFGLGLGQSLQKLYFLPHPHSDFVFAIVCEELGLVGASAILGLFALLLWRGARAGLRAPDRFGAFLAWGFTALLVIQALTHISVSLSLLPTKGIPLPFVSYGGSALVTTLTACGVLLNVSEHA